MARKAGKSNAQTWNGHRPNYEPSEYESSRINELRQQHTILDQWTPNQKELIAFMWDNFKVERFPLLGQKVWDDISEIVRIGADHPKVLSGEFENMILHIKQVVLSL